MASRACPFIGGEQPRLTCWIGALPSLRKESSTLLPRTCPLTSITGQGIEGCICCAGNCTAAAIIIAVIVIAVINLVAVIALILSHRLSHISTGNRDNLRITRAPARRVDVMKTLSDAS
jgi:hypothetical protein